MGLADQFGSFDRASRSPNTTSKQAGKGRVAKRPSCHSKLQIWVCLKLEPSTRQASLQTLHCKTWAPSKIHAVRLTCSSRTCVVDSMQNSKLDSNLTAGFPDCMMGQSSLFSRHAANCLVHSSDVGKRQRGNPDVPECSKQTSNVGSEPLMYDFSELYQHWQHRRFVWSQ